MSVLCQDLNTICTIAAMSDVRPPPDAVAGNAVEIKSWLHYDGQKVVGSNPPTFALYFLYFLRGQRLLVIDSGEEIGVEDSPQATMCEYKYTDGNR